IQLRNLALRLVKARGIWERSHGGPHLLMFREGANGLVIGYRTPFQRVPPPSALAKYVAALNCKASFGNLPYGLDVWRKYKVLNIEWSDDGCVDLVSYRSGQWERELKRLCCTI
ncbi:MAG: hypothetical protein WAK55_09930, partial [Xanthobacteraceae bacterium]